MITADKRKRDISWNIAQNPTEISFTRNSKDVVDGHFEEKTANVTLIVRIYLQKNNDINISSDIKGTSYESAAYGMIADSKANLNIDSRNSIEFDTPYGHMKIKQVYPQIVMGETCGYQCDLERVM